MLNRDSNGHVIRLSRDLTDHVTRVVTRLGPDGVLLGDPHVYRGLCLLSLRGLQPRKLLRLRRCAPLWKMNGGRDFSCPSAGPQQKEDLQYQLKNLSHRTENSTLSFQTSS